MLRKNLLLILSLIICLQFTGCGSLKKRVQTPEGPKEVEVTDVVEETNVENEKPVEVVDVEPNNELLEVIKFNNFYKSEISRFWLYNKKMNNTVNSQCFSDFIKNRKLIQTNGNSNEEVLKILRGKKPKLEFTMYYSLKRVVGYTYPNVNKIWFNRRLHKNFSLCKSASNLGHEISHKLGFGHDFNATQRRPYSVPYSINAGFTACCK